MKRNNDIKYYRELVHGVPGMSIQDSLTHYPNLPEGIPLLVVQNDFSRLVLSLNGAHIISFTPAGKNDLLWLSPKSQMTDGLPIRGGIPLCLPWFGPKEGLPLHGFARLSHWDLKEAASVEGGGSRIVLTLSDNEITRKLWPHEFYFEYVIISAADLDLSLRVVNKSNAPCPLAFAYHTYFNIGDVEKVVIDGLENCPYRDRLDGGVVKEQSEAIEISGPIERMYGSAPKVQTISSPTGHYQIVSDSSSALLWNAWNNDRNIPDMGEGNHVGYVCVERGNMANGGELLPPGGSFRADMTLSAI